MNKKVAFAALLVLALAACGGGSSVPNPNPNPNPNPSQNPVATGNIPMNATVGTASAWVDPTSQRTLYFLSNDPSNGSACTGGCLGLWPVDAPSAGAAGSGNMTLITRSDGTGQQWAYQGHPLYKYAGDTGPLQAHGEGIPLNGGIWHVARPNSSSGGGGGGGCTGNYC